MGRGYFRQTVYQQYFSINHNAQSLVTAAGRRSHDIDVWRTLAMFSVYIFHCFFYARYNLSATQFEVFYSDTPYILKWVWSGDRGVDVFFVISGFLIGRILFLEYKNTGDINLKSFYLRRLFRLMPVYLLAMIVYGAIGAANTEQLWANALFVNNFIPVGDSAMPWCWSLAVEEQFYLLLPFAILIAFKAGNKPVLCMLMVCMASVVVRAVLLLNNPEIAGSPARNLMFDGATFNHFFDVLYNNLYSRFGELMAGVLGSYLAIFHQSSLCQFFQGRYAIALVCAALAVLVALLFYGGLQFDQHSIFYMESAHKRVAYIVANRLVFAIGVLVILLYFYTRGNERPLAVVDAKATFWGFYARLSYSIYVFHPFVIFPVFQLLYQYSATTSVNNFTFYYCFIPVAIVLAMALSTILAVIVYLLVEKPFLNISDDLSSSNNNSAKQLPIAN